jgi:hypothetical protein
MICDLIVAIRRGLQGNAPEVGGRLSVAELGKRAAAGTNVLSYLFLNLLLVPLFLVS